MSPPEIVSGRAHLDALKEPLARFEEHVERIDRWGREAARVLRDGGRLLAAGNGGSAAQAQHLTGELVGRYRAERQPLSAIALHAETSTFTSIANDYGLDEVFARQVRAHGRAGDILVALSTSGTSSNVLSAVRAAREIGLTTWGLTGPAPNPLADLCDETVSVAAEQTPTIQELHLVAVHLLCAAVDLELA
jgi:D-sedoheptulose 7-phosphate isomerase